MARTGRARSAIVVGGGIGGLAAAVGLHRTGWHVEVLERAPVIAEVGAGLSLWPNAVRALEALGLGAEVSGRAVRAVSRGNIRTPGGQWLRHAHPEDAGVLAIHRAELHDVLSAALPADVLRTDATVVAIRDGADRPHGDQIVATYELSAGRQQVAADLLVAADGIDSVVRRQLMPGHADSSFRGRTVWRGLTEPDSVWPVQESLTLGRGMQFGALPLIDHRVYWFLTANADEPGLRYDDELAEVRHRVADWHAPIPALLDATRAAHVLHHDIVDLDPLPAYTRGRTVLVGDAAHAMTPDLGQGACQALEDAVVLASVLESGSDLTSALAAYDRQRRPRTQQIAGAARQSNARNLNESPLAHALTMLLIRLLPVGAWRKSTARWVDWTPPALSA